MSGVFCQITGAAATKSSAHQENLQILMVFQETDFLDREGIVLVSCDIHHCINHQSRKFGVV